ncbi:MAG: recombinase family protein [Bryobacteraceae bacterium]
MTQRSRDLVAGPLTLDYFMRRAADGWRPAAIEWVRDVDVQETAVDVAAAVTSSLEPEEIPYGLHIGEDGLHLEPNPVENTVLLLILEKIVMEKRLNQIADDLNSRGFRTRKGTRWSSPAIFDLLPRLIEAGPKLLESADWRERRGQINRSHLQA